MLSIRMKLIGTCVILLGIQAAVVGLGLYELSGANTRLEATVQGPAAAARLAAQVRTAMAKTSRAQRELMLASGDDERRVAAGAVDAFARERDDLRRQLGAAVGPAFSGKLDELDAL